MGSAGIASGADRQTGPAVGGPVSRNACAATRMKAFAVVVTPAHAQSSERLEFLVHWCSASALWSIRAVKGTRPRLDAFGIHVTTIHKCIETKLGEMRGLAQRNFVQAVETGLALPA